MTHEDDLCSLGCMRKTYYLIPDPCHLICLERDILVNKLEVGSKVMVSL